MTSRSVAYFVIGAIAWLGTSSAQAVVTTYCCDAGAESAYLADLAAFGVTLSTPHEGFDASPWGADTSLLHGGLPAPSVTNRGITWTPLSTTASGFLATSTGGGDVQDGGYLMYAVDSGMISHPIPDGFSLAASGSFLHGVAGWFRGDSAKLAFVVDGDAGRVNFTGAEATVVDWKFLGFIDTVSFTGVEIHTSDEVGNETRIFFTDAFTFGTTAPPNSVPVANPDAYSVDEGGALSPAVPGVLVNDTDADNLPPTNAWDGLIAVVGIPPSHASAFMLNSDGSFAYTHDGSETTSDSFTYQAFDGTDYSGFATVTITVNPINDAPVADAQSVSTDEDTPLAITLSGSDVDGDALTYALVAGSGPSHGTLSGTAPNLTYTPALDYQGPDSFAFTVSDPSLETSAPATVSITVNPINDAPVAAGDSYTVGQGMTLSQPAPGVLGNDTDVEQAPLAAVLTPGGSPLHAMAFTLNSDGSLIYTHNGSETTSDSFTYQAFDGTDYSQPATVDITVTPVNDAPVGASDSYNLLQGGIFDVAGPGVLGNDSDPDNLPPADAWQGLTAALVPGKGPLHAFDFQLFADGGFTYTHDDGGSTGDSFVYTASDGALESAEVTVSLTLAPSTCTGAGDVTISQRAFTKGLNTCDGGTSITLGPTVWVAPPAQLVLTAPVIRFQPGVVVETGARLSAGPPP